MKKWEVSDFKDDKWMNAGEKLHVLKLWIAFLKSKFTRDKFTDKLYKHLTLHCSFIAHYDINGFYNTYFSAGSESNRINFIRQFNRGKSVEYGGTYWLDYPGYGDLNRAMCEEMQKVSDELLSIAIDTEKALDIMEATRLLDKHKMKYRLWHFDGSVCANAGE